MQAIYVKERPLGQNIVHASNENLHKDTTGPGNGEVSKVFNAYELMMMTKGDKLKMTPRNRIMKAMKSSTWTSGGKKIKEKN